MFEFKMNIKRQKLGRGAVVVQGKSMTHILRP